jgi:hypothetical protein
MTSLIYFTNQKEILVATDTLATDVDGSPLLFSSKAIYLPHLRTIIAGTGLGAFSGEWAYFVNSWMVTSGIENLDSHTPDILRKRWEDLKNSQAFNPKVTTTVYHFGFSEIDDSVVTIAYRSANNFCSERISFGMAAKPECAVPQGDNVDVVGSLEPMMIGQLAIQRNRPVEERIHIGGQCVALHLTSENCSTWKVFDFEDHEKQLAEIFQNHTAQLG